MAVMRGRPAGEVMNRRRPATLGRLAHA